MSNNIIQVLTPVFNVLLVALATVITKEVVKVVPVGISFIKAKIGLANYQKLKNTAWDVWHKVEEDGRLGKLLQSKVDTFKKLIQTKFPNLTDDEIDTIRQAIAGEFNKDKPKIEETIQDPVPEPQTVTVEPIMKYVTPEGIELQPVTTTIIDQNISATLSQ